MMKKVTTIGFICFFLCLSMVSRAQVIKIENGIAITDLKVKGSSYNPIYPYQASIGLEYMDRGHWGLSSSIGFLRKGTSFGLLDEEASMVEKGDGRLHLDYLTLNTTFRLKTNSLSGTNAYVGVGPRVDIYLDGRYKSDYLSGKETGTHKLIAGLKAEVGIDQQIGRYRIGLNASYLPSVVKPYGGKTSTTKEQTFTLGIVLGYLL